MPATTRREADSTEQRRHTRIGLPVGYAAVRATPVGRKKSERRGHVYDLSEGGMRFELDAALDLDEPIEVELDLPSSEGPVAIRARGSAVRFHDEPDDGPGPIRMGMQFDRVDQPDRLGAYISQAAASRAA